MILDAVGVVYRVMDAVCIHGLEDVFKHDIHYEPAAAFYLRKPVSILACRAVHDLNTGLVSDKQAAVERIQGLKGLDMGADGYRFTETKNIRRFAILADQLKIRYTGVTGTVSIRGNPFAEFLAVNKKRRLNSSGLA